MRQLQAKSWERFGSSAVVYGPISEVRFSEPLLSRLEIHQGNSDEIADIIAEARNPESPVPKRRTSLARKPGVGRKTI